MFATKRSRGMTVALVAGAAVVGGAAVDNYAEQRVAERSTAVEVRLLNGLPRLTLTDALTGDRAEQVIGSYRQIKQTDDGGLAVSVEVGVMWRTRCVIGTKDRTGAVAARIVPGRCT